MTVTLFLPKRIGKIEDTPSPMMRISDDLIIFRVACKRF